MSAVPDSYSRFQVSHRPARRSAGAKVTTPYPTSTSSVTNLIGRMSNNERILKEDAILEYQEAFNQFDPERTGLVGTKDLGNLLRFLGF